MATPTVQNLKEKNEAYASDFKHGELVLPPAKKYLVLVRLQFLVSIFFFFFFSFLSLPFFSFYTRAQLTTCPNAPSAHKTQTCMDARIIPSAAFGIDIGDAHVIRNAGASARDALRSILISQQLLGTKEVLLVKHTGCGMLTFSNEDAHALVAQRLGPTAAAEIATLDFLPFGDLEQAVREDVAFLRKQSAVPEDIAISGWVYEVETGRVRQVE